MSIAPIASAALPALPSLPSVGTGSVESAATGGQDFSKMVVDAIENLEGLQATSDDLATQATTGELTDVHDYMIASTEATVATELTVAVRNKAVEAFNSIMQMGV
ncbi:MAG: flagellar hook-basal body complex protein FliE [Acidimicrobiales bacterium]